MNEPGFVALPIGDPNGIGPELAVKAAAALRDHDGIRAVVIGDSFVIAHYADALGLGIDASDDGSGGSRTIRVRSVDALPKSAFTPGRVCGEAGSATVAYIAEAIACVRSGRAIAIAAGPHNETAINAAGIRFSGYPGLLARLAGVPEDRVFLMLVGAGLRIVHVTLHERLQDALQRVTPELVEAAALAAIEALQAQGLAAPRIGIFGINPHAGEGGLFGHDDDRATAPAAERLRQAGHQVEGPLGADLLLGRRDFDAFVAIYHDQGHIPIKLLAGRSASAVSVGAGLVFSTVGHGSAFDIAGTNRADPEPLLKAISLVAGGNQAAANAARGAVL